MSRKFHCLMGIAAVGFLAGAYYLWQQKEAAELSARDQALGRQFLEQRVRDLQERNETLESQYAELRRTTSSKEKSLIALEPAVTSAEPNQEAIPSQQGGLNDDLINSLELAAPLAGEMARILSREQAKLAQLFANRATSFVDPRAVVAIREETDRVARKLLGEPKFQEYLDFRQYVTERGRIGRFDKRLKGEGIEPLSDYQRSSLLAVMKEEKNAMPVLDATRFLTDAEYQQAVNEARQAYERRVQERASAILSYSQLARFNDANSSPSMR